MKLRDSNGYALCPTIKGVERISKTNWKQTWIHRKGRSLKDIALQYCGEHPEARKQIASKALPEYEGKPEIKETILHEEEKYWKLLERGSKIVVQLKQEELTGAKLCELHDTYGIDPTIVEDVLGKDLPQSVHDEYLNERAKLQAISRASQKKTVITVKNLSK